MLHAPASNRQSHNASSSGNFEHAGAKAAQHSDSPGAMHSDKKSQIHLCSIFYAAIKMYAMLPV